MRVLHSYPGSATAGGQIFPHHHRAGQTGRLHGQLLHSEIQRGVMKQHKQQWRSQFYISDKVDIICQYGRKREREASELENVLLCITALIILRSFFLFVLFCVFYSSESDLVNTPETCDHLQPSQFRAAPAEDDVQVIHPPEQKFIPQNKNHSSI